ncbi:hypothetical protein, partial [Enterococcus faecalis]|uniref:hypothetical protein n=1 Tax=Enterococcus faecalis TaxID=1351 RepID=UPI003CC5B844
VFCSNFLFCGKIIAVCNQKKFKHKTFILIKLYKFAKKNITAIVLLFLLKNILDRFEANI